MRTWIFEPGHTAAEFVARHMMVTKVRGRFSDIGGQIELDPEDLSRGSVEAHIDVSTLHTGEEARDEHLRSEDFLDVKEHPEMLYRGEIEKALGCREFRVAGELTLRGVTREVPLRPEAGEREEHLAYLSGGRVVLLTEPERHLNHSCDPNAFVRTVKGETRVLARRRIEAGEEVTLDYLINTHGGSSWACDCGADRCRGTLETSFFELPDEFQREYLPLLEEWFVEEHRDRVEQLRRRLEGGER